MERDEPHIGLCLFANFSRRKCKVLRIGTRIQEMYGYKLENDGPQPEETRTVLGWSQREKDLGVQVEGDLEFKEEVCIRAKKGNAIMGIIRRTFTYLNEDTFCLLFKSLVRPHLEYASSVWSPYLKQDIARLEAVQRRATKQVPGLRNLPYPERLRHLKLPTLRFRRRRGDMIEVFKILHGMYDINHEDFFERNVDASTRGHSLKLKKIRSNTRRRLTSFARRVITDWNALPDAVVAATSLISFKNRLDKYWQHHPQLYDWEAE